MRFQNYPNALLRGFNNWSYRFNNWFVIDPGVLLKRKISKERAILGTIIVRFTRLFIQLYE
jgi:hypothetical protein